MSGEQSTEEKKLLRMSPAEAAAVVLDDILSDADKEAVARNAFEGIRRELANSGNPDYQTGIAVCTAVYQTPENSLMGFEEYRERMFIPLGVLPLEKGYEVLTEEGECVDVDPMSLITQVGMRVRERFDGNYRPETAREEADAARRRATDSGEAVLVKTPSRGMTPAGSISTESSYSGEHQSQDSQPGAPVDGTPSVERSASALEELGSSVTREIETPSQDIKLVKGVTPRQGMQ